MRNEQIKRSILIMKDGQGFLEELSGWGEVQGWDPVHQGGSPSMVGAAGGHDVKGNEAGYT